MGAGFFGVLLLDPIIMRRIRAARADCVSLVNIKISSAAGGFDLQTPLVFFDFDLSVSLASVFLAWSAPAVLSATGETADCGLSSCCLECTITPGFSGHFPTAAAVVCRLENDSAGSPPATSSSYPGGGFGVPAAVFSGRSGHCGFA